MRDLQLSRSSCIARRITTPGFAPWPFRPLPRSLPSARRPGPGRARKHCRPCFHRFLDDALAVAVVAVVTVVVRGMPGAAPELLPTRLRLHRPFLSGPANEDAGGGAFLFLARWVQLLSWPTGRPGSDKSHGCRSLCQVGRGGRELRFASAGLWPQGQQQHQALGGPDAADLHPQVTLAWCRNLFQNPTANWMGRIVLGGSRG